MSKTKPQPVWVIGDSCRVLDEDGQPQTFPTGSAVVDYFSRHDKSFTGKLYFSYRYAAKLAKKQRLNLCMVLCTAPGI